MLALLPELYALHCDGNSYPFPAYVRIRNYLQRNCRLRGCPCPDCMARRRVDSCDFNNGIAYLRHTGVGSAATTTACLLFAIIDPATTYWAYAFVASVVSAMGVDFIFSAGTLFIAKYSPPHEQSVVAALFSTMTRVRLPHSSAICVPDNGNWSIAGYRRWCHCVVGCFQ